jgi:hypothetical protein
VFEPTSAVFGFGRSLDKMKEAYEAERDKEFAAPRLRKVSKSKQSE